jgi:hypothetical protein
MLWAVRRSSNSEQQQEVRAPMLSLRTHALIAAGLFVGLLVIGWGGSLLDASGLARTSRLSRSRLSFWCSGYAPVWPSRPCR